MKEKPKCTVIGCGNVYVVHSHHRKRGISYDSVCGKHLKEIKRAYLKEDVEKKFTIVCVRGEASAADIEAFVGPTEKQPMTSIPCGNGDHEDCGGEGCECGCHGEISRQ